jgi:hypothetical protein
MKSREFPMHHRPADSAHSPWRLRLLGIVLCVVVAGCTPRKTVRIVPMGERAEVGPFVYSVLEAQWKSQLGDQIAPRLPAHRFLLLRVSVTNGSPRVFSVPRMVLLGAAGDEYPELTDGEGVDEWFGVLRRVAPVETVTRWILFDVPRNSYHLRVSDDAFDPADVKSALIEIPIRMESSASDYLPPSRPR